MSRIGILTFHRSINNGAFMQCYALCERLRADFPQHDIRVIDYGMPKVDAALYPAGIRQYFAGGGSLRRKAHLGLILLRDPSLLKRQRAKNSSFENARKQLPLSEKTIYSDETRELFDYINDTFDVVISGSDAVWNYSLRGFPNPYFLDEDIRAKKMSYAASCFGMNYENIPADESEKIRRILDSYSFIGVRDEESEKFARQLGVQREIWHNCDPTVLLDTENLPVDMDVLKNKLRTAGFDFDREAVGVMGDEALCAFVRNAYGSRYQVVSLFNYSRYADVNLYDINPFEWAAVFRYFKITFTTYFHGTLLSLRNGTPVAALALKTAYTQKHTAKVLDFLMRTGLEKWYFTDMAALKAGADGILKGDYKESIIRSMDNEADSYNIFKNKLKELLEEK